jgi:hypothetical protein
VSNIDNSVNYVTGLQESGHQAAKHGALQGDFLLGTAVIGGTHWYKNRQRTKLGMPAQPMNKWAGAGIAYGLGWVFWWLPFLVYMLLEVFVFHSVILAVIGTGVLFIGAWVLYKRHRARKYAAYYAAKPMKITKAEDYNAPLSDEWLSSTGDRLRKNLHG